MYNSLKTSLSFMLLLIFSMGAAQADCIVTTKNFSKSSRLIYVNPTNGSDQLAKIYNYNLGNQRNPYEPKRIVAFQNLNEALATRNTRNGDLVLVKTGRTWTKYDDWSQNKSSEFNKQSAQASGYSQTQCQGENLTWVPSAVTDTQSADTASTPITEFANANDITVANTEVITSRSTTSNQVVTTTQSSTSPTTSRRSSGGSSSGGSSSGSNSLSPTTDTASDLQQNEPVLYSRGGSTLNQTPLQNEVIAEIDPSLTEGGIDEDVTPVENQPDNLNQYYAAECTVDAPWQNAIQTYPKDSQGWSIIKPDIETKIVYVSSSEGNDSLGKTYNGLSMADPFNPGNVQAYKTVEKAYAQIRDGKPDWILLKKGDQFELEKTLWMKTGKSQKAHIVLGAYGEKNGKRPVIDTKEGNIIQGLKNRGYNTIVGIEFYARLKDPNSPYFGGWNTKGKSAITNLASNVNGDKFLKGLHIENNRFSYFNLAITLGSMEGAMHTNTVIRRNEILNSYSTTGHSQGMFLSMVNGALIEENILDHNGWTQQRPTNVALNTKTDGYATFFNHNIYIENSSNLVLRKNLSSRSSSIGMKFTSNSNSDTKLDTVNSQNILLENNVIVEGEVGLSLGGNKDFNNGHRWDNIQVVGNVLSNIGRTQPTNRDIAWNIDVSDWKSGLVCGNYVIDNGNTSISNVSGIIVQGHIGELTIDKNTIINQAKTIETFTKTTSSELTSSDNLYIFKKDATNKLDAYVKEAGYMNYSTYIKDVLVQLENNPSNHYRIDDLLNYMERESLVEKTNYLQQ